MSNPPSAELPFTGQPSTGKDVTGHAAAQLRWDDTGQPISTRYGDVYFSKHNGLAESRYVFLQQNALAERWQAHLPQQTFYIGETGFGSGLNFLAAWQLWQQTVPADKQLHFISVENEPLQHADLQKALTLWPELTEQARALLAVYPQLPTAGFHPFSFADQRVKLTLIIADATAGLEQLLMSGHPLYRQPFHPGMDAWFLDGFAPAKNPSMWQAELFDRIAALSHQQTSLATFTAAGTVKRELQRVGFHVEKRPGYGKKRDMLAARYAGSANTSDIKTSCYPVPWHVISTFEAQEPRCTTKPAVGRLHLRDRLRHGCRSRAYKDVFTACLGDGVGQLPAPRKENTTTAIIIGAGLAGSHTARALAERGWQITVLEQAETIATGASGNAQGIVYGKLSSDEDGLALFNLASLLFAQRCYHSYWQNQPNIGQQCGLLQLALTDKEHYLREKLRATFAQAGDFIRFPDPAQTSRIAGIHIETSAIHFPQLGWLAPARLCQQLLDHPNIQVRCNTHVAALEHSGAGWQLLDTHGKLIAAAGKVVIANAHDALNFAQTRHLPLKPIRGQVSYFKETTLPLNTVVCSDGYIAPAVQSRHGRLQSFGATFTLHEQRPEVLMEDHRKNLASLARSIPALEGKLRHIDLETLAGRASFRCTTADYLPLVGPAPDYDRFVDRYRALSKNAKADVPHAGPYLPGLYLNVGHGSRGLAYTPLSSALLAAQMDGDSLPVPRDLAIALNPARFIVRNLIRNRIKAPPGNE